MKKRITILSAALVAALAGCDAGREGSDAFETTDEINRVVVDVDTGDVSLTGEEGFDGALVDAGISCRTAVPDREIHVSGDTLYIRLDAGTNPSACEGFFEIRVSSDVTVELNTGKGDIEVNNLRGDLDVVTYDGDVRMSRISGNLEVTAVSGNVVGTDLSDAPGSLTVGSGNVSLTYLTVPTMVDVDIMMGDALLTVPATAYRVDAVTNSGQVTVDGIDQTTNAPNTLQLAVDTGDINITANQY